jgi:hypothetical protein
VHWKISRQKSPTAVGASNRTRGGDLSRGDEGAQACGRPRSSCARRTGSLDSLLPVLYLRGISTGDFQEVLSALLGTDAPNLSPAVIRAAWLPHHPKSGIAPCRRSAADLPVRRNSLRQFLRFDHGCAGRTFGSEFLVRGALGVYPLGSGVVCYTQMPQSAAMAFLRRIIAKQ